ncbi:MAG: redoxin domain-containing protein [Myxococcota bacterium]|nr:redoxin domain-containing protein [Myxococcota bacterium]
MNKWVLMAGLLIAAPLVWILASGFGKDPHAIVSPLVGKEAPTFTLRPLKGGEAVGLKRGGLPTVLNFWATWCRPCVQEHGVLSAAAQRYRGKVRFLGLVYEDTEIRIRSYIKKSGAAYPILIDEAGKTAIAYGVYGVPETFFISAEGEIIAKHAGPLSPQAIEGYLQKLSAL